MILERSREALDQAEQSYARLSATSDDKQFRGEFVSCIGMIHRVGAIIDGESKGHRTPAFGSW